MAHRCAPALRADMRHVYGLDITSIRPTEAADLAANLPDGSMVWRALGTPNAWTLDQHMLATQIEQMQAWMWANSDPKKRGRKPKPIPRPGDHADTGRRNDTITMTADQLDTFLAQEFSDVTPWEGA